MCGPAWETLDLETKFKAIRHYARIVCELSCLHFDCIGSIYFKPNTPPPHCFRLGPIAWQKHESEAREKCCTYDRGPWKTSYAWLKAALSDELEFMQRLPELAKAKYGSHPDSKHRWRLAQSVLPRMLDRLSDTIQDPLDRCSREPFILAHMDLSPRLVPLAFLHQHKLFTRILLGTSSLLRMGPMRGRLFPSSTGRWHQLLLSGNSSATPRGSIQSNALTRA